MHSILKYILCVAVAVSAGYLPGGAQQLSSETSDDDADIRINPEVDYRQTVDDEEKIEIPSFIKRDADTIRMKIGRAHV